MVTIGLDDTDNLESRGTGHLARQIAARLSDDFAVYGVTRHQLLVDPRVPCTKNNSSAVITLDYPDDGELQDLFDAIRVWMLNEFQPGSDPGLCVARQVPEPICEFGWRVKRELVTQEDAIKLADQYSILLAGLGGTNGGVIGALAAVGLSASGDDGRYIQVGRLRELEGLQPVGVILQSGISAVKTMDDNFVAQGLVQTEKLRPARRGSQPIAYVEWQDDHWQPLKLD